ncbi:MAG: YeeE/YedE family protein [Ignavibacteriae bacterium]|jgi:uncharacterized membrane protein YedE/YeeE|nr:hypothetical protein [Ignavibacteriota bacterium]NOG98975.1 YeeE/YedE family protein [Ignavibacteriota bacterium]
MKSKPYMNPYAAGFLLGLVLLATIYITGRGLGASGAFKSVTVETVKTVAPNHHASSEFYSSYEESNPGGPLKSWLFWEVLGVFVGAFISALLSNRINLRMERGPNVTHRVRVAAAVLGGALFGFGSQFGRGCTSGSALSGMAVMSFGGIITMLAIFGSAYMLAYFFRNLWINRG